jgi:hypothetical protein
MKPASKNDVLMVGHFVASVVWGAHGNWLGVAISSVFILIFLVNEWMQK